MISLFGREALLAQQLRPHPPLQGFAGTRLITGKRHGVLGLWPKLGKEAAVRAIWATAFLEATALHARRHPFELLGAEKREEETPDDLVALERFHLCLGEREPVVRGWTE